MFVDGARTTSRAQLPLVPENQSTLLDPTDDRLDSFYYALLTILLREAYFTKKARHSHPSALPRPPVAVLGSLDPDANQHHSLTLAFSPYSRTHLHDEIATPLDHPPSELVRAQRREEFANERLERLWSCRRRELLVAELGSADSPNVSCLSSRGLSP